jgi:hypothetical protein
VTVTFQRKGDMMDAFSHLGFEEYFSLAVIGLFVLTPFIAVAIEKAIDVIREDINRRLKPHGLRLRQR